MDELLNELKEERLDRNVQIIDHYCEPPVFYLMAHGKLKPEEAFENDLIDKDELEEIKKNGIDNTNKALDLFGYTELSIGNDKNFCVETEFSSNSERLYSDEEFKTFEDVLQKSITNTVESILWLKDNINENTSIEDLGLSESQIRDIVEDLNHITNFEKSSLLQEIFLSDLEILAGETNCRELYENLDYADYSFSEELLEKIWLPEKILPEKYDSFRVVEILSTDDDDSYLSYALQAGRNNMLYDSIDVFESVEQALSYAEHMYKANPGDVEVIRDIYNYLWQSIRKYITEV